MLTKEDYKALLALVDEHLDSLFSKGPFFIGDELYEIVKWLDIQGRLQSLVATS